MNKIIIFRSGLLGRAKMLITKRRMLREGWLEIKRTSVLNSKGRKKTMVEYKRFFDGSVLRKFFNN